MSAIRINFVNFAFKIKDFHLIKKKINMVNHTVNHKTTELNNSLKNKDKIRILFVCLGNICRSPAAEGVMLAEIDAAGDSARWVVDSAGTGGYHIGDLPDKRMRIHARRRGYDLTHRARKVREADFADFDLIIGMDAANVRDLRRLAPTPADEAKVLPMADFFTHATRYDYVPDPYYEGAEGFELVLDLLQGAVARLHTLVASPL